MLQSLVMWLVIGGLAGWLAGLIIEGFGFGVFGNVALGSLGALLAGIVTQWFDIQPANTLTSLLCATLGALVVLAAVGFVRRL